MSNANTLSELGFTRPFVPAECARILGDGHFHFGNAGSTSVSGQMFDRVSCTTGNSTTVTDRTVTLQMTKLSSSP